ncbi:MAG TPA: hypothetical protein VGS11_02315 [Candidatus Bathyarchaeia archaeon]|nr:hypothetical protein [Candidatus Bathyarchaeia archaeon]
MRKHLRTPPYLPLFLGLGLFSFGIIMVSTTGMLSSANMPKADRGKSGPIRLEVLMYSYITVPFAIVLLLLALANMNAWSGSPAAYVGACGLGILILFPGIRAGWCYSIIWDGFWIDVLLYTMIGYGIIIFLSMIPKMRPPCIQFPELED